MSTDAHPADERGPRRGTAWIDHGPPAIFDHEARFPTDQWCPAGVPERLHTPAWARADIRTARRYLTDAEVDTAVDTRMGRAEAMKASAPRHRFLITSAGLIAMKPHLTQADLLAQSVQIVELDALLPHIQVRLAPAQARTAHRQWFSLCDGKVYAEHILGTGRLAGADPGDSQSLFEDLWAQAQPISGPASTH